VSKRRIPSGVDVNVIDFDALMAEEGQPNMRIGTFAYYQHGCNLWIIDPDAVGELVTKEDPWRPPYYKMTDGRRSLIPDGFARITPEDLLVIPSAPVPLEQFVRVFSRRLEDNYESFRKLFAMETDETFCDWIVQASIAIEDYMCNVHVFQLPTYVLPGAVLGIVSQPHAEQVAEDMFDGIADSVDLTVVKREDTLV
jgi:hypothetical protein